MLYKCKYLPLHSIAMLNRSIRSYTPDFAFDHSLSLLLTEKLKDCPLSEHRGMLLVDEMQISKHVDFRSDLGKNVVGLVNFGSYIIANDSHSLPCSVEQKHQVKHQWNLEIQANTSQTFPRQGP